MVLGRSWFSRVCTFCPRNVSLNAVQEIMQAILGHPFSTYPQKLPFFDTSFPLARTLFVEYFWMPFKSETCHRWLADILLCKEMNQGIISTCYIYIYTWDMHGKRLPHIFETPYISIYKPSISNKTPSISSRNLGFRSKYLVFEINNFEILGFSHIWFRVKQVFNPGFLTDPVHIL